MRYLYACLLVVLSSCSNPFADSFFHEDYPDALVATDSLTGVWARYMDDRLADTIEIFDSGDIDGYVFGVGSIQGRIVTGKSTIEIDSSKCRGRHSFYHFDFRENHLAISEVTRCSLNLMGEWHRDIKLKNIFD